MKTRLSEYTKKQSKRARRRRWRCPRQPTSPRRKTWWCPLLLQHLQSISCALPSWMILTWFKTVGQTTLVLYSIYFTIIEEMPGKIVYEWLFRPTSPHAIMLQHRHSSFELFTRWTYRVSPWESCMVYTIMRLSQWKAVLVKYVRLHLFRDSVLSLSLCRSKVLFHHLKSGGDVKVGILTELYLTLII